MAYNGNFRSFFGAVAVPIIDKADGTISTVTHDWANATAGIGGGLAVTIMRLQIRNHRVDIAKERLAELAIKNNCQFVFFIDDDVIVPGDALMKMIRRWKSDPKYKIQSGVYWSKSSPAMPLVFRGDLEGSYWDWTTQDLIKADGAGAGCLFIDTEVLKKMPKPWFSCDYFFEDPRTVLDLKKWELGDQLGEELTKGKYANLQLVAELQRQLQEVGDKIQEVMAGNFDPQFLHNKHRDPNTTEDLYFFKKAKENGFDLWVDCSVQCLHQDKRTGEVWGISADMPQAQPRYYGTKKMEPGKAVVLDLGAGTAPYWIAEGRAIRVDIDETTHPDVVADARDLPFDDCFADGLYASHMLEHFSFRETVSVLKEWVRVLKVGGFIRVIVPNLRWSASNIMNPDALKNLETAERSMFMYFSGQQNRSKVADSYFDIHKAGFTPESIKGLFDRIGNLEDVNVYTSQGTLGNWKDEEMLMENGLGYNIVIEARKKYHDSAVSLKHNITEQEAVKDKIGPKAIALDEETDFQMHLDALTQKPIEKPKNKTKKVVKKVVEDTKPKRGRKAKASTDPLLTMEPKIGKKTAKTRQKEGLS